MADTEQNLHAIFIPLHLQGHVKPSIDLAIKLALNKGFKITFIVTKRVDHEIRKALQQPQPDHGSARPDDDDIFRRIRTSLSLDIRCVTVSDGMPLDFDEKANLEEFLRAFLYTFEAYMEEAVGNIVESSSCAPCPPVSVVIADTFYPWISRVANKYGLLYASFWTEPALAFSLYSHRHLLRHNGHIFCQDKREDAIDYIPGVKSLEPKDLISYLQEKDDSTVMHKIIFTAFDDVKHNADFVLCNTIQELETDTISDLQSTTGIPFYAIGPTFPLNFNQSRLVPTSFWTEIDCSDWLDTKPQGSVLYVSFGSLVHINKDIIVELAYGLLLSNVDFVWVLRPGIDDSTSTRASDKSQQFLPADFKADAQGRGLVVPWTCQVAVLSHPATGGFVTHCGWNSVLESIWSKVPMLCFPQYTDQPTNRKLVVDEWKIGLDLCCKMPIKREEISESIKLLMSQESDWLRKNVAEQKLMLENALKMDGSSERNMDLFIQNLKIKTAAKRT